MDGRSLEARASASAVGGSLVVAVVWIVSCLLLHRWLAIDDRPLSWDAAEHAFSAVSYYQLILSHRLSLDGILSVQFWYPPLVYLVVVPFFGLLGAHPDVAVWASAAVFLLVLFAGTYAAAARLGGRLCGIVAVLLIASYPAVIHDSRNFMLDIPLAAAVIAGFYALLRSDGFRRRGASLAFGVLSGLGVLIKWTYPIYLAAPALVAAAKGLTDRDGRVKAMANILLAGALGLA
ncbi:MAG TPA: phospholipid carrier-dependent glycosyltransferase, partial [Proteobacteria bacterium]|nr:phospholipid carrier-dependent glycosyltransferase [Pseudomonadota bacterium]